MARLLVPSEYATINNAVNDASSGDVIVVSSGTYTEDIASDSDEANLTIRADHGAQVTVIGTLELLSGWILRGILFIPPEDTTCLYFNNPGGSAYVYDCEFDVSGEVNGQPFAATSTSTVEFRRCIFRDLNSDEAMMELVGCSLRMSSCLFKNCHSTAGSDLISAGDADLYNCTFVDVSTDGSVVETAGVIANCIAEDCTVGDYVFSADTTVYCNVSNADGGTPYRDAGTGCTETVNRFVDKDAGNYALAVDQQGTAAYLATSIDLNRFSFAGTPSKGCYQFFRPRSSLQGHYIALSPVGLKVSVGTDVAVAAVSSLGVKNYTGGYDLARALDLLVGDALGHGEVALTYEPDGRYRAQREDTSATFVFSLTTEGQVAAAMGTVSYTNVADTDA